MEEAVCPIHLRPNHAAKGRMKGFCHAVRQARHEAKLSREKLAFRAGIQPTYVSQVERGVKSPSLDVVAGIVKALNRKASALVRAAEDAE